LRRLLRWQTARRATQIAFLALFAYLVLRGHGVPEGTGWRVAAAVQPEFFFLGNPYLWLTAGLASRAMLEATPWILLFFLLLTLVFGRVFCGWICPLGTCIDGAGRLLRPHRLEVKAARERRQRTAAAVIKPALGGHTKYYVLLAVFAMAAFGVNMAGWLDPLAILTRGTLFALAPAYEWLVDASLGRAAYWPVVGNVMQPVYLWVEQHTTNPFPHAYGQAALHAAVLLGVLALSRLRRRYWCHVLCPLGALYGLISRVALLRRRVNKAACNDCSVCALTCRMEAVESGNAAAVDAGECLRCMECGGVCPKSGITFSFFPPQPDAAAVPRELHLTRRGLLGALVAGTACVPLARLKPFSRMGEEEGLAPLGLDAHFLRPPGALPETDFLRLCVRCGECFGICPQNALHPALFQAGLEALWTPTLVPRIGYCDPACILCGSVCPTGALKPLTPLLKPTAGRPGTAAFDRSRCIPWARGTPCGVCEEMCPVSPKAIEILVVRVHNAEGQMVDVSAPIMRLDRCIGCGLCENKCPVEGQSAVRVTRAGASRETAAVTGYGP
jgi:ferredoxin